MELIGAAVVAMRDSPDPRITLEVAFLRLSRPEDELSLDAMTERIDRLERRLEDTPATEVRHSQPAPAAAQHQDLPTAGGGALATLPEPDDRGQPSDRRQEESEIRQVDDEPAVRPALGAFLRAGSPTPTSAPVAATTPAAETIATGAAVEAVEPKVESVSVGGVPSLDALRSAWQDSILGGLRLKVRAIFQLGRFVEIDDGVAVLAVPNDAHLSHADPLRPELEAALTSYFGTSVGVRLISETTGRDQTDRSTPSRGQPSSTSRPTSTNSPALDDPDELDGSDEDFADISAPIDADDRTSAASTGIDWARERVLKAFPGAEEV
jgi:hypothetical protein